MPSVMQTISGISPWIAGFLLRLGNGIEHGQIEMYRTTFARRCSADHLGPIRNRGLRVEGAILAGEALADDLGVFVDED
jgi:hypothetical protein